MPPLVEQTPQTDFTIVPIGASQRDVEALLRMNAEQFRTLYPKIEYRRLDRVVTKEDELYREWEGFPTHADPVLIPALLIPSPQMTLLRKYGLDENQECVAVLCNRLNDQAGIFPHTGDLLRYLGIDWEILTAVHSDYLLNSEVPLNVILTLKQSALR